MSNERVPLALLHAIGESWELELSEKEKEEGGLTDSEATELAFISGLNVIMSILIEKFGEDLTFAARKF